MNRAVTEERVNGQEFGEKMAVKMKESVSSLDSRLQRLLVVVFMGKGTTVGLSSDEKPSPFEESAVNTGSHEQTSSDLKTSSGC
ncbi:hypothetical protein GCK32_005951, partial [Trichostrongylus colubriformis]